MIVLRRVGIGTTSPSTKLEVTDANGIGLRFGDVASTPSSQTAGYVGMSTSAYSGNNGDLVLIPRTSATSKILLMEGNVGIGTTSPNAKLEVTGSSDGNLTSAIFANTVQGGTNDTVAVELQLAGTSGQVAASTLRAGKGEDWTSGTSRSGFLAIEAVLDGTNRQMAYFGSDGDGSSKVSFSTNNSERMRINSSGVMGIGTTSPSDNSTTCLFLKGNEHVMSIRNQSTSSAGERVSIDFLDHNGTRRGYISVDTSGTLFSTSSDYRLKNVIEPVQNGIERINKLKPVKFEWKETGKEEEGFIAHEVDEIFKDAVGGKKDAVNEDGSIDGQTMDYGRITPLLVKAIQEQQEQIEQLKTEIQTLKGE